MTPRRAISPHDSGSHFDPEPGERSSQQLHWRTLRALLPLLWPYGRIDLRLRVAAAIIALIAAKAVTVYVPFLYKAAVDSLAPEASAALAAVAVPVALIIAYGVSRIMMIGLAQLRDGLFAEVGQNAVRVVAVRTFRHIHALSLRFHLDRRTGALNRVIERGTKGIEFLLRFTLFNILPTIIELILVCGILGWMFGIWYTAVTGLAMGLYIWFTFAVTEWRTAFRRQMNDRDADANTKAIDSLLNFETVKYFGNEEHEARRFDKSMIGYEAAAVKTTTSLAWLNTGQTVIFTAGLTAIMLMAGFGIARGTMTIGDFVLVNAFLIQLYQPLNLLGSVYREIKQSLIDMEAMFNLLDVAPEIADREAAPDLKVEGGEVAFDHVSFAYDAERGILHDVSFRVPAGNTLALVGPSGAGKSTISRLLFRFYEPVEGRILIDGQDIREVKQKSLRAAIGMVPQDTVLFNDTIRYNIRYGRPDATDEEVENAARLAQIADFIAKLPSGYDTMVGERGLKLSGGEKQRVAIARTILKNPPILLLDEATSALDSHTEKEIQAALRQVSHNRTTLIIAHRLSTVVEADEILVLEHGRIVERGRHGDLVARGGKYAAMWNRQREVDRVREQLEETLAHETEIEMSDSAPAGAVSEIDQTR